MARKKVQFAAGFAVIIGAVLYLALSGFQEGKAYYRTLEELDTLGPNTSGQRLRVAGIVTDGSIRRNGTEVTFQLEQEHRRLVVRYVGDQPIPDTFKGGVEAIVEGERQDDGSFEADQIQAKCASKYEAEYGAEEKPHE
ncbi:MAG: cytochrome c maturation protein CcmE [Candidatus Krumholzibacteria bacterium]|nr:cytochrome c maturation protein CcmE [Candidatus Krumholzibacteria bacterium]